jgi:Mg/Co/Ni transporter MgtE
MQKLKQMFIDMDTDGSGGLDIKELQEGFKVLGLKTKKGKDLTPGQYDGFFRDLDLNGDGIVTQEEFTDVITSAVEKQILAAERVAKGGAKAAELKGLKADKRTAALKDMPTDDRAATLAAMPNKKCIFELKALSTTERAETLGAMTAKECAAVLGAMAAAERSAEIAAMTTAEHTGEVAAALESMTPKEREATMENLASTDKNAHMRLQMENNSRAHERAAAKALREENKAMIEAISPKKSPRPASPGTPI